MAPVYSLYQQKMRSIGRLWILMIYLFSHRQAFARNTPGLLDPLSDTLESISLSMNYQDTQIKPSTL